MRSLIAPLAALLVIAAAPAPAQEMGDVRAGRNLAEQVCAVCHMVWPDGPVMTAPNGAPAFLAVANRPETTPLWLSAFLITPHPTMPNLMLSSDEAANVIAYVMSLRRKP